MAKAKFGEKAESIFINEHFELFALGMRPHEQLDQTHCCLVVLSVYHAMKVLTPYGQAQ